MTRCKKILLRLSSNLSNYKIAVYDNKTYVSKIIYSRNGVIEFNTLSPYIIIVAKHISPLYSKPLYFKLNANCNRIPLDLRFSKRVTPLKIYTFTLRDRNYGLKINGTLFFSSR